MVGGNFGDSDNKMKNLYLLYFNSYKEAEKRVKEAQVKADKAMEIANSSPNQETEKKAKELIAKVNEEIRNKITKQGNLRIYTKSMNQEIDKVLEEIESISLFAYNSITTANSNPEPVLVGKEYNPKIVLIGIEFPVSSYVKTILATFLYKNKEFRITFENETVKINGFQPTVSNKAPLTTLFDNLISSDKPNTLIYCHNNPEDHKLDDCGQIILEKNTLILIKYILI